MRKARRVPRGWPAATLTLGTVSGNVFFLGAGEGEREDLRLEAGLLLRVERAFFGIPRELTQVPGSAADF